MLHLKPSEIRYSQNSISNKFDSNSLHSDVLIGETLDDLIEEKVRVDDIPVIEVMEEDDKWVSADNRRLWVFKNLEKFGNCETIAVKVGSIQPFKNTSKTDGLSVKIRLGGAPGGRYFFVLQVLENVLNDHDIKMQKMRTIIAKNEDEFNRSGSLVLQLRREITKQLSEIEDIKTRSEEIVNKLNLSREINQKNITACKKIIMEKDAEMDVLNEKLNNTRVDLSKPETELENRENTSSSYVRRPYVGSTQPVPYGGSKTASSGVRRPYVGSETASSYISSPFGGSKTANAGVSRPYVRSRTASKFEDNISVLKLQLFDCRKRLQIQIEANSTMEATYKEKLWSLESDNESLRNSNSATKTAEYEAKIHSMTEELERVNENYGLLERHMKQIYDADTMTIEQLKKEIGTIEEENDRLKQTICKKDKQMTEIRRLTVSLYGLVKK